jgi:hypothetical protein
MTASLTKVSSFARSHTEGAVRVLAMIMHCDDTPPAARVAAANSLLDRGWGKPAQTIMGDESNPLRLIQRIERVIIDPIEPPPF